MKLVLAEKPSVAQSLAKVLGVTNRQDGYLEGNGYIVSWCVGHLVELAQPEAYDERYGKWTYGDLPILPDDWKYEVSAGTRKQFGILKKLMARDDVVSLVCATDAGREGELIFRLVYHQCHCKKPFERLWISSMEDSAIMEGFEILKPGTEYDALYEAALCRERADWIVGINATRLFSTLYGQTLNVGRVMTPTLAMAVMREAAISAFKSEPFYTVQLAMDGFTASSERFKKQSEAEALRTACNGQMAKVTKAERKEKTEKPPALYDLTSLQRDANRVLGYTAQQTLDYTQNLYEKKLVTYPRTDSRYLTEDMAAMLPDLVHLTFNSFPVDGVKNIPVNAKQVINNKKVTDHHAIIPTKELQKCNFAELPKGELAILQLISNRLCVAVGDPHRYAETVIELDCGGTAFSVKGKTILHDGWKALVKKYNSTKNDENEQVLPSVSVGDEIAVISTEIKEGKTSPPKHYTEDTLLQSMETAGADEMPNEVERKGLGTPATRAGIIEKLVRIGFLERQGDKKTKHLIPTHKGTALVTVMPEQIQSPSMTADWEEKLLLIEKGEYASEDFMDEIKDMIAGLIQNYEVIRDSEVLMSKESNAVGKCPVCGSSVEEKVKAFFCSNRSCKFALWKNNRYFESIGKSMTSATAQKLLGSGKIKLKGCKSAKTGNTFDATVYMSVSDDGKTQFTMEFDNGGKRK
ncbi:DNA topoisomerase 3 [Bariatricus sp. HCP28S3_E4]|uniref:type IA DNA topoisomerase n=1 Tax=unclassified Bariatricus TaxID=2677046 RepID=UPI003F889D4B